MTRIAEDPAMAELVAEIEEDFVAGEDGIVDAACLPAGRILQPRLRCSG